MKTLLTFFTFLILTILISTNCTNSNKVNVLVVTGGHVYDTANYLRMWDAIPNIAYDTLIQPSANHMYDQPMMDTMDVIVFYDMYQEISEQQKAAFLELLKQGKGIVFTHHCLASYQNWPEYIQIIGGRYSEDTSGYSHDLDIPVEIVDPKHPVTKGLENFVIHDESYFNVAVLPDVKPLLRTDHPESMELLGWTHRYAQSKIVYIQPGHDNNAFSDANYRGLIEGAVKYVK